MSIMWVWGNNDVGQLGLNDTANRSSPVTTAFDFTKVVTSGGHSTNHSIAIDPSGMVWTWGSNSYGCLALGDTANRSTPTQISRPSSYIDIAGCRVNSYFLDADGSLWGVGYGGFGQLGNPLQNSSSPKLIAASVVKIVSSGACDHAFYIDNIGNMYGFGQNGSGQLGDGSQINRSIPTLIGVYSDVALGSYQSGFGNGHSVFIDASGSLWATGYNIFGQLGDNTTVSKSSPISISFANPIIKVAAGNNTSFALDNVNQVWSWGTNSLGQLGLGDTVNRSTPTLVSFTGLTGSIVNIAGNISSFMAIDSTGKLWGWGQNTHGELGLGDITDRSTPTLISTGVTTFQSISLSDHFLGLENLPSPPTCWEFIAKFKNSNRLFKMNGPGLFPKSLNIPRNVDRSTARMIDEGKLIDPSRYNLL